MTLPHEGHRFGSPTRWIITYRHLSLVKHTHVLLVYKIWMLCSVCTIPIKVIIIFLVYRVLGRTLFRWSYKGHLSGSYTNNQRLIITREIYHVTQTYWTLNVVVWYSMYKYVYLLLHAQELRFRPLNSADMWLTDLFSGSV